LDRTPNIAILILAAGNSSRMNRPKQLLPWKNTFLLNHVIKIAQFISKENIYVVLGAHYDLIKPKIKKKDITLIVNNDWQKGMGKSIALGAQHIKNSYINFDAILILLADQPLFNKDYLKQLINKFQVGNHQIIASLYGTKTIGVPALFDHYYFNELSQLKLDIGARILIKTYIQNVKYIDANNFSADIDTKEDYELLYQANHQ